MAIDELFLTNQKWLLYPLKMEIMIISHLVTSPSFLSTARALLSIHCNESMCAFSTW